MKRFLYLTLGSILFLQSQPINIYANTTNILVDKNKVSNENNKEAMQTLLTNYRKFLVGNEEMNKLEQVKVKIQNIEKNAEKSLNLFKGTNNPNQLFKGKEYDMSKDATINASLPTSDAFNKTAILIENIALGYSTYGTKYYQDENVKVILQDIISSFYNTFSQYINYENDEGLLFGNWWNWEIGVPIRMTNTLILTKEIIEEKDKTLLEKYVKCFDNYLRNGKNNDVDLTAPQHTGTNLIDITTNRILQGVLIEDSKRIEKAVNDMNTVFNTIDPYNLVNNNTDGVYPDGSFIQHHRVAYTGSYGKLLLQKAVSSLYMLNDTPWQPKEQIEIIKNWIYNSFLPVMHEGYMMEIVKGRSVSRTNTGYQDSVGVVEAMTLLSTYLDAQDKANMQAQIKYLAQKTPLNLKIKDLTLAAISPYVEIIENQNIIPNNKIEKGSYSFNAMDRNVQIGNGFTFSLARSSNRIAKYESMSGENLQAWFQGDGAFYLYLNGQNQTEKYGIDYITTINPNNYPGTTTPNEERKTTIDLYKMPYYPLWPSGSKEQNDFVYFPTSSNEFSGSVTSGDITLAGMQLGDDLAYTTKSKGLLPKDFVVYKNVDANKSWLMSNDEIVAVGSNIHDKNKRSVTTTVDNIMHNINDKVKVYAGTNENEIKTLTDGTYSNIKYLAYENKTNNTNIGYYFPQPINITIKQSIVSKNQKVVRNVANQKDNIITKGYTTITFEHGINPQFDNYSYVIKPNANLFDMQKYVNNKNINILENSNNVHVIEDTQNKIKAYNFFTKGNSNNVSVSSPASIIIKEIDNGYNISVSDPLFTQNHIEITLNENLNLSQQNPNIKVSKDGNKTKFIISTNKLYGKTINFNVTK